LEAWLLTVWGSWYAGGAAPMEDVVRATIKLFLQRPTSVPRFEDLCANTPATYSSLFRLHGDRFRRICDKVQVGQLRSESPPVSLYSIWNFFLRVIESVFSQQSPFPLTGKPSFRRNRQVTTDTKVGGDKYSETPVRE